MGCGINWRDAFSYTLAMTAIAAFSNDHDKAKAFLAESGYDVVSTAALNSVRHAHADEIGEMVDEVAPALMQAYEGHISHDELTARLRNVAIRHAFGYLDRNPAADPMVLMRRMSRLRDSALQTA